ncbi:MAG: hypothetical protein K5923_03455 [Clostridia bacterium]|nr:hypothetical protein [Clostridia bacterium]
MNKKLLPIIIILSIILSLTIFVACDKTEEDPHQFLNIKLTDGTNVETYLITSYKYGQTLDIFDTLGIVLEYRDGNVTLTAESEEFKDVIITYSKEDGTAIEAFGKHSLLDPGNYTVSVSYQNSTASLSIYISQTDFTDNYQIVIKEAASTSKPSMSKYEYGSDKMTYAIYAQNGTELNKNLINALFTLNTTEKAEYDALEDEAAKIQYLNSHTSNSIYLINDTGIIGTTGLLPGTYYMFALINETTTQVSGYTKPTDILMVTKGKIVMTNDFVVNQIATHGEYQFLDYVLPGETPKMTINGTKALSLMEVGINYNETNAEVEIEGSMYPIGAIGTFTFTDSTARVDAANNGQNKQVKFTLIDYYNERYIVTNSAESSADARWSIPLQITQAEIYPPNYNGTVNDDLIEYTEYNGTSQNIAINLNMSSIEEFVNISGNKQTNAGTYAAIVTLKDSINYKWSTATDLNYYGVYSDAERGARTFNWKIDKASGYFDTTLTYLGQTITDTTVYYQKGQQNNKEIGVTLSSKYIDAVLAENKEITWSYDYGGATGVDLVIDTTLKGATNIITFTYLRDSRFDYINLSVSIPECANYKAYTDSNYPGSIDVYSAVLTDEEVNAIFAALPAEKQQDGSYLYTGGAETAPNVLDLYAYWTGSVDNIDYYLVPPQTLPNPVSVNDYVLGEWVLYQDNALHPDTPHSNGERIETTDIVNDDVWYFRFVIADDCVKYVPEDIGQPIEMRVNAGDYYSIHLTKIENANP